MKNKRVAIPGFDGYEISCDGRVWSRWKRVGSPRNGTAGFAITGGLRQIRGIKKENGYIAVNLKGPASLVRNLSVHVLVLNSFVGLAPPGNECRHLDGDRSNNRLTNLKWGTKSENEADRKRHGRIPRGESHGCAILTNNAVIEIRARHASGVRAMTLADEYGVTSGSIYSIVARRSWRHV